MESRVGDRGLSGFVARAVAHELERDLLEEFLSELDDEFGEVPPTLVQQIVSSGGGAVVTHDPADISLLAARHPNVSVISV